MSYLIPNDYLKQIQDLSLQQVISGNSYFQQSMELAAQAEMNSYLVQKYDTLKEFTDTNAYDPTRNYNAADRVYLDATAYSSSATYTLGTLTFNGGNIYECSTAITVAEAFTPAHWTLLGKQYDIFFANYPYPVFNITTGCYKKGDIVFWRNHTYTALQETRLYSHEDLLQFHQQTNIPYRNIFPNDPVNGRNAWHDNGQYAVPAGNLLTAPPGETIQFLQARPDFEIEHGVTAGMTIGSRTFYNISLKGWTYSIERVGYGTMYLGVDYSIDNDPGIDQFGWKLLSPQSPIAAGERFVHHFIPIVSDTAPAALPSGLTVAQIILQYFTKGDNRNQQILMFYIDIVLYHLYSRVAPKNTPEIRVNRYASAIDWLKKAGRGDITADLIKIQPPQGGRIRSGSVVKNINSY